MANAYKCNRCKNLFIGYPINSFNFPTGAYATTVRVDLCEVCNKKSKEEYNIK